MTLSVRFGTYFAFATPQPELAKLSAQQYPSMVSSFQTKDVFARHPRQVTLFEIVTDGEKADIPIENLIAQKDLFTSRSHSESFSESMAKIQNYRETAEQMLAFS